MVFLWKVVLVSLVRSPGYRYRANQATLALLKGARENVVFGAMGDNPG